MCIIDLMSLSVQLNINVDLETQFKGSDDTVK